MKKVSLLISMLTLFLYGCGDPFRNLENSPALKGDIKPADASGAIEKTAISCDFSTTVATTKFPGIVWPSTLPYDEAKYLELKSETAQGNHSSFSSSKRTSTTKTERQKEICDQLENEFVGFDNPYYRRQQYLEVYAMAQLKEATKNLRPDEYAAIKPEKSFFTVEYADPKGNTKEPIKTKNIAIEVSCPESTKVKTDDYRLLSFTFKHSHTCTFEAVDQEYKLNSGEKIKLSMAGSLGSDAQGLVLKVKEVSWRDAK